MRKARALPINVYRQADCGDCTNGGVTSKYERLLLLCNEGFVDVDLDNPPEELVRVVSRDLFGKVVYHIEPFASVKKGNIGWMMGGNYAATSDSRFADMVGGIYGAIPVHDRQETQDLYDLLSM